MTTLVFNLEAISFFIAVILYFCLLGILLVFVIGNRVNRRKFYFLYTLLLLLTFKIIHDTLNFFAGFNYLGFTVLGNVLFEVCLLLLFIGFIFSFKLKSDKLLLGGVLLFAVFSIFFEILVQSDLVLIFSAFFRIALSIFVAFFILMEIIKNEL